MIHLIPGLLHTSTGSPPATPFLTLLAASSASSDMKGQLLSAAAKMAEAVAGPTPFSLVTAASACLTAASLGGVLLLLLRLVTRCLRPSVVAAWTSAACKTQQQQQQK